MAQKTEETELEEVPLVDPSRVSLEDFSRSPALEYILREISDEHGEQVARALADKGEATSEEIAREIDVKQKFVRRVLEDLYEKRAAKFRRTKDSETGWITFRWQLDPPQALERLRERKRSLLQEAREKLEHEREATFFACEDRCVRVEFDEAMGNAFRCPECGGELREIDNGDTVRALEEKIEKLERELE